MKVELVPSDSDSIPAVFFVYYLEAYPPCQRRDCQEISPPQPVQNSGNQLVDQEGYVERQQDQRQLKHNLDLLFYWQGHSIVRICALSLLNICIFRM